MQTALLLLEEFVYSDVAQTIFRIFLAICFGALIGLEREHAHRPAGLRTHVLVCVGACLVMLTAEHVYDYYHQFSPNMDVTRLGAQVISGIGFLGAGTIIRNGSSIKGLTTAASIWVVGCIGLATGIGYYAGATIATIAIFLVLAYIKTITKFYDSKKMILKIKTTNIKIANDIEKILFSSGINVNNLLINSDKEVAEMLFHISMSDSVNITPTISQIYELGDIKSISTATTKTSKED